MGRPTDYNDDISQQICEAISTSSFGLKKLCKENPHWPSHQTVYMWRFRHKEFDDRYARAMEARTELLVDEITDIADDGENDTITRTDKHGNEYEAINQEWVQRSRLRIDARKWVASKLKPKKYGDSGNQEQAPEDVPFTKRAKSKK